jgi:hypothetical protein
MLPLDEKTLAKLVLPAHTVRRGRTEAVTSENPVAGKKFRGVKRVWQAGDKRKGGRSPLFLSLSQDFYARAASKAVARVFKPAAMSVPR